jgi:hypothetical protein
MYKRAFVTVLAVLLVGPVALAEGRTRPLRLVEPAVRTPVSDHVRYVSYLVPAPAVRVWDTKTGARYDQPLPPDDDCVTRDAHAGIVLVVCGRSTEFATYHLLFAASRTMVAANLPAHPTTSYFFVGRYWLDGHRCEPHCAPVYTNWRTGEQRLVPTGVRPDLDSPDLRPLDPRQASSLSRGGPRRRHLYFRPAGLRASRVLVRRCAAACYDLEAFGGRATWMEDLTAYGFIYRGRQRCTWRVRRPFGTTRLPVAINLLATNYAMVASVWVRPATPPISYEQALYRARWTRC